MTIRRVAPSLVVVALVTVALTAVVVTVVGLRREPEVHTARLAVAPRVALPRPEVEAAAVLAAWDADRAAAWAAGDVRRLRSLYAPGSVAGERDAARLRQWRDRGLTVDGLRTQVLAIREVSRGLHRWVLAVTDRVVGGSAGRFALPGDSASSWTVVLHRSAADWVVASVTPGG